MIHISRTIYFTNEPHPRGGVNCSDLLSEVDERSAMTILVFDVLEQAIEIKSLEPESLSFATQGPNGRREIWRFSGYKHYMLPLFLVASQYVFNRSVILAPIAGVTADPSKVHPVTGFEPNSSSQFWGDLVQQYPLKLAIARGLVPDWMPKALIEALKVPLDEHLKEAFNFYDSHLAKSFQVEAPVF